MSVGIPPQPPSVGSVAATRTTSVLPSPVVSAVVTPRHSEYVIAPLVCTRDFHAPNGPPDAGVSDTAQVLGALANPRITWSTHASATTRSARAPASRRPSATAAAEKIPGTAESVARPTNVPSPAPRATETLPPWSVHASPTMTGPPGSWCTYTRSGIVSPSVTGPSAMSLTWRVDSSSVPPE